MQQEQGKKILKRCGMNTSQLSLYETSEPLAYYSHHRQTPQNFKFVILFGYSSLAQMNCMLYKLYKKG